MTHSPKTPEKMLLIGLDCATNWIVDRMISQNKLPNLKKMIETGVYFTMESEDPVLSPVVWTSIASGKLPNKHGVKSFYATSDTVKVKRIWDIFQEHSLSVGVMGYFITWPPKPVNGFIVPDLLALDGQTYPEGYGFLHNLTAESKMGKSLRIAEIIRYFSLMLKNGVRYSTLFEAAKLFVGKKLIKYDFRDEIYKLRALKLKIYRDVFIFLNKKFNPTFSSFHCHLIDSTSHEFWRYFEPTKFPDMDESEIQRFGHRIYDAYIEADNALGKILSLQADNTLVAIVSDHGAKSIVDSSIHWHTPLINAEKLMQTLAVENQISYATLGFDLLWKPRTENDVEQEKLKEIFQKIKVVEDGEPLFDIIDYKDGNSLLRVNKKISDVHKKHLIINGEERKISGFIKAASKKASGTHDGKSSILILNGPGIRKGYKGGKSVKVVDFLPTVLAAMNLRVAKDFDGKVITEVFTEDFLKSFPIKFIDSYETKKDSQSSDDMMVSDEIKKQLKALGYL